MKYAAFLSTIRAVPLMYASAKADFLILAMSSIISGIAPAIWIYTTVLVVDSLVASPPGGSLSLQPVLAVWAVAFLLPRLATPIMQYYQANLAEKFTAYINLSLMEKSSRIKGLSHLDDERYYNCIKTLEEGARSRPVNVVSVIFFLMRDAITIIAICVTLASITWWLPIIFLLGLYPGIIASLRFRELAWKALLGRSAQAREMEYLSHIALNASFSLESRIYAYFPWLKRRYSSLFERTHKEMRAIRGKATLGTLPIELFSVACIIGMVYWSLIQIREETLTIGTIVSLLQSLALGHAALFAVVESVGIIFERGLFFTLYFDFLSIHDSFPEGTERAISPEIVRFVDVSFTYPNGIEAVKGVSFDIKRGECIAIVGANGSGKSTLIKLLLRLYDPTSGRVEVDGRDLRTIEIDSWRTRFGIVQQDVVHYAFTVRENIQLSDIERPDPDDHASLQALDIAALSNLSAALDLRLGKEFSGLELSGGQWQKLSIARAFFRNPDMLILDEPSAALDPRSEARFFASLQMLAKDKTTLFITHRLGAVRLADRILVMRNGELIESGTHEELLQSNGEYASLWHAQVSQYQPKSSMVATAQPRL
ncbi:MAG: ABC transporter ATP-binding protein [Gammaproteobacteria bacterium]|nr:ABC transporter ATP-binding protein [Gammaproteobacteria bacterium]